VTRVLTFPRLLPQQAITKKRTEKTEVRAAARDAALREIKERQRKAKASKKKLDCVPDASRARGIAAEAGTGSLWILARLAFNTQVGGPA
jgi:hypothetical protein